MYICYSLRMAQECLTFDSYIQDKFTLIFTAKQNNLKTILLASFPRLAELNMWKFYRIYI